MLFRTTVRAVIGASILTMSASAQTLVVSPTANVAVAPITTLRQGTSVPLRTLAALTTNGKQLRVGQRFDLETTGAVALDGQVVIPVGSHAVAEITNVRNKGMWGKSGAIAARLVSVTVNGRDIRLSGTFDSKGETGTAGVVGAIAILPVAGFFMTGTSAQLAANTQVTGYLAEDVPVAFGTQPPAPAMSAVATGAPAPVVGGAAVMRVSATTTAAAPKK